MIFGIRYQKRNLMPERKPREQTERKNKQEPLKIAHVVYGTKNLAECMESVIKGYLVK